MQRARAGLDLRWKVALGAGFLVAIYVALWNAVVGWTALNPVAGVGRATQQWVVQTLRACAEGEPRPLAPPAAVWWELRRRFPGPIFVQLYERGRVVASYQSEPRLRLAGALAGACEALAGVLAGKSVQDRRASRFKVDLTTAQGPILVRPRVLLALSVVPGLDGLGLETPEGRRVYLTPDELLRRNLVTGYRPFKFVAEFKAGLHVDVAGRILAERAGLPEPKKGELPPGRLFRFRTFGFVEGAWKPIGWTDFGYVARSDGTHRDQTDYSGPGRRTEPLEVLRGNTLPAPELNRHNVLAACIRGGRYILRMLSRKRQQVQVRFVREPWGEVHYETEWEHLPGARVFQRVQSLVRGQFRYIYFPLTDNYLLGGYSLPRHAGATHVLALLAGILARQDSVPRWIVADFRKGAELAISYLVDRIRRGRCRGADYVCVSLGNVTDLGSTALPLAAVLEYVRQTGDRRYESVARKMANFLLFMQDGDGDFCHIYRVDRAERECDTKLLYYSGEAAYALAMAYHVLGDERYLRAAERALDYQTGPYLAPLTMKFLYGEDHWTAIAAHEIWPAVRKDAYAQFAYGFADYQQIQQFVPGEAFEDYVGGYGITPFFPPHLTPAGSRTEAAVAAYKLSLKRGEPRPDILHQIRLAFSYILRHQVRLDNSYMFANPWKSVGAIRKSPVKYDVRIDYVQHTVAAMIQGLEFVPE